MHASSAAACFSACSNKGRQIGDSMHGVVMSEIPQLQHHPHRPASSHRRGTGTLHCSRAYGSMHMHAKTTKMRVQLARLVAIAKGAVGSHASRSPILCLCCAYSYLLRASPCVLRKGADACIALVC